MASRTWSIFSGERVVIREPIFPLETVWIWSQFTAQSFDMPSALDKKASLGISLIVEVMGATETILRVFKK
jgi:hypothetical protein